MTSMKGSGWGTGATIQDPRTLKKIGKLFEFFSFEKKNPNFVLTPPRWTSDADVGGRGSTPLAVTQEDCLVG